MPRYTLELKQRIITLRSEGCTYPEICAKIGINIPQGSLTYICRNTHLTPEQQERIKQIMRDKSEINRQKAVAANKRILTEKIVGYRTANLNIRPLLRDRRAKLIALAMLYLGEGAKWKGRRGPKLGSTNPNILKLYIQLLRDCYDIPIDTLRCSIQHRADQDPSALLDFWSNTLGIEKTKFYPSYVDRRTIGHVTQNSDYKGVCSVTCRGTHIQLELEQIAGIICEAVAGT